MFILFLTIAFIVWCIFYTKHHGIGKFIYESSYSLETKAAKLFHVEQSKNGEAFSYLTNHQPSKPPMLLLHGFSADKTIWLKYAKLASKDYNLFIVDLMAHGDIQYNEQQNYSAYEQAKYVRRFLDVVNIKEPINIVGNSMGGMIAAILAKVDTANTGDDHKAIAINKLVLLNPAGAKTELALQRKKEEHNPFAHDSVDESIAFFDLTMHKPPFVPPAVKAYLAQTNFLSKKEQLTHMLTDFFNPDEFFDVPFTTSANEIILIWGKEDQLLPVSDAQQWENLLGCKASILSGIGHMPMVECPKQTYSFIH
jgi:pimeloyl-ACP methyl ester carboxylesterase